MTEWKEEYDDEISSYGCMGDCGDIHQLIVLSKCGIAELCEKWLKISDGTFDVKVRVKVKEGAILLQRIE